MNGGNFGKLLNGILAALSVAMIAIWAWKFFGPESGGTRRAGISRLAGAGINFYTLLWLSIAIVCLGYLLWRFLSMLFWKKYFKDEKPPEEGE